MLLVPVSHACHCCMLSGENNPKESDNLMDEPLEPSDRHFALYEVCTHFEELQKKGKRVSKHKEK